MNKEQCCFFTGHRTIPIAEREDLRVAVEDVIEKLAQEYGVKYFITGGALGFDTMAANAVIKMRKKYDIKLILFLPCKDQTAKWNLRDVEEYEKILDLSDEHYYISEKYTNDCMLKRNRKMADASSYCVSYMRRNYGGTSYTVNYATRNGVDIISL